VEVQYLNGRKLFVIPGFLTPQECRAFIERSEQLGYSDAPINTLFGPLLRKDVRDNQRILLDDPDLAAAWWERAKELVVEEWFGWKAVGFNERFRFYRYDPGQRFAPHMDGCFERENGEQSHFTFLVYLNEGFEGGETAFHEGRASLRVRPEAGKALVFHHPQVHEGTPVVRGRKYILRTDVMYRYKSS
jgi:predicted 2-oxoglutarate/Fe(II)-dependent dioxygenase YbiX